MRYDVEILGFEGEPDVAALASTFRLDERTARALVAAVPRVVKRDVDEAMAEELFHVLRELGARVRLNRLATSTRPPPPASSPPPSALPAPDLPLPDFEEPPPASRPASLAPASLAPPGALPPPATRPEEPLGEARGSFVGDLVKAYLYPFQWMLPLLAIGVGACAQLFSYVPAAGGLISAGVWASVVFTAVRYAANGRDDLPGLELEGVYEMALPGIRFLLALFVPALLLGVLYGLLAAGSSHAEAALTGEGSFTLAGAPLLFLVPLGLWLLYLPASLILAAHSQGCLGGLNVVAGIQLMVREPAAYAMTIAAAAPAGIATAGVWIAAGLVDRVMPIPFVIGFAANALALVPALIGGRILGLFIWHHEHELGLT